MACVLPGWLFVGYLTVTALERGRQSLDQSLSAAAHGQMRVVEREMAAVEASLQALATSPSLEQRDYAAFHAQAQVVLRHSPGLNIVLLGPAGEQIINTLQPPGTPLPVKPPELFARVRESQRPVLSDIFIGPITGRPLISLVVPVIRDGRLVNVLGMSLDAEHLGPILNQDGAPDSWAAAIFDSKGVIVARTWEPEKYVGQKAGVAFQAAFRASSRGMVEATTLEGIPILAAFARSERYGWTMSVAVPKVVLEAELRRSFWISLSAGAALLLVGLFLAHRISRGITRPVQTLIASAEAIGHGAPLPAEPLELLEAEEVRRALAAAAALIEKRTVERDLARIGEIEIQLQHRTLRALNDIAALPGANTDWQLVESLRLGAGHFGLPLGIISRIEDDIYTVLHHCAPEGADLEDGRQFSLGQTYCALTLEMDGVMAIAHMKLSDHAHHPCYAEFGLEAYIGAPLYVRNRRFGTVSFSSLEPQTREFDEGDKEFMRLLTRWIGTVIERQLSDAEIATARQDLERSNVELEQFAYVASHDLRQPLRMISSYLSLIQRRLGSGLEGELEDFFGFAVDGAKRMDRMILDLLDYSRTGRDKTPFEAVALADALADALANLHVPVAEAGATVTVGSGLPTVLGHRTELVRLFQNLIGNAIKYRSAERPIQVSVDGRSAGPDWIVSVSDNGIGVPAEDRERAFVIFQRLVMPDAYEGTGLGLAVCRKIVEAQGGRIWIEDGIDGGISVCFALPREG